jgi:hypothetical protein
LATTSTGGALDHAGRVHNCRSVSPRQREIGHYAFVPRSLPLVLGAASLCIVAMGCGGSTTLQVEHESALACELLVRSAKADAWHNISAIDEALGDAEAATRGDRGYRPLSDAFAALDNALHKHDRSLALVAGTAALKACSESNETV